MPRSTRASPSRLARLSLAATSALLLAMAPSAGTITLLPVADNTLYESALGQLSNGKGLYCFTGLTAMEQRRRALLRFDVAGQLPAGATITSASLTLNVSKAAITLPLSFSVHRVLAAWGEGASDAPDEEGSGQFAASNDATWLHTFYASSFWTTPGGDWSAVPSATRDLGPLGDATWSSTAALVADVQAWLDTPNQNHGWIVRGSEDVPSSAKRFNTREHPDIATRPRLTIEYTPSSGCGASVSALETPRAGVPPNPSAFLPGTTSKPLLGATWDPRVDHASFAPGAWIDIVAVSTQSTNVPLSFGTLLCSLAPPLQLSTRPAGVPFAIAVPNDCALAGVALFAQAGSLDTAGALALANALDLVLGTQ